MNSPQNFPLENNCQGCTEALISNRHAMKYSHRHLTFTVSRTVYRAMHFSAKRGIAIACRLSVRPSVCLSVCNVGEL